MICKAALWKSLHTSSIHQTGHALQIPAHHKPSTAFFLVVGFILCYCDDYASHFTPRHCLSSRQLLLCIGQDAIQTWQNVTQSFHGPCTCEPQTITRLWNVGSLACPAPCSASAITPCCKRQILCKKGLWTLACLPAACNMCVSPRRISF